MNLSIFSRVFKNRPEFEGLCGYEVAFSLHTGHDLDWFLNLVEESYADAFV